MASNSTSSKIITSKAGDDSSQQISESEASYKINSSRASKSEDDKKEVSLSAELSIEDLVDEWVKVMLEKGLKGLSNEFMALYSKTKPSANDYSVFLANQNSDRNRYQNVVCLNRSRVKLYNHPSGNDYIHANYVSTPFSKRRFICTQAPLDYTIFDFWFMIIQEKVQYIIMLTNFIEKGYHKSTQYFPLKIDKTNNFSGIIVKCLSCERRMDFECEIWERSLLVQLPGFESTVVTHFHWTDWPDHGIPKSYSCPLQLLETVRMSSTPIVLHCSAGIGRTGCLVLIELILEKFLCKQTSINISATLSEIRKQRAYLIQNDIQYLYVHRTLLHFFIFAGLIKRMNEVQEFIKDYDQFTISKFTTNKNFPHC